MGKVKCLGCGKSDYFYDCWCECDDKFETIPHCPSCKPKAEAWSDGDPNGAGSRLFRQTYPESAKPKPYRDDSVLFGSFGWTRGQADAEWRGYVQLTKESFGHRLELLGEPTAASGERCGYVYRFRRHYK